MKILKVLLYLLCGNCLAQLNSAILNWDGADSTLMGLPQTLSVSGFDPGNSTVFVPYDVNVPQYLNLMNITRYVSVPAGQKIIPGDTMDYIFPAGTAFIRVIGLDTVYEDLSTRKNIEVQIQIRSADARWLRLNYVYPFEGGDAELMNGTAFHSRKYTTNIQGKNLPYIDKNTGTPLNQVTFKYFRTQRSCNNCHYNSSTNGFITQQLNKGNQLQELVNKNVLANLPNLAAMTAAGKVLNWVDKNDGTATLDRKVLSYLAANCSHCHNHLEERASTGKLTSFQFYREPVSDTPAFMNEAITVVAGDPENSPVITRLIQATMPGGLMVDVPDAEGIKLLWDWVNTLDSNTANNVPYGGLELVGVNEHKENFKSKPMGFSYQNGLLIFGVTNIQFFNIQLFDLVGKSIPIKNITDGIYHVPKGLKSGIYFVKAENVRHMFVVQ